MEQIRQATQDARDYLDVHAGEARYTDSEAVAELFEGLRVGVMGPTGETLVTDMPQSIGGGASAPSPGWIFRAAIASCTATLIAMRAAQIGVELSSLQVTVTSESDDRGLLGIAEGVPAGPLSVRVAVRLHADAADSQLLETLARYGLDHCPVVDAVQRPVPVELVVDTSAEAGGTRTRRA